MILSVGFITDIEAFTDHIDGFLILTLILEYVGISRINKRDIKIIGTIPTESGIQRFFGVFFGIFYVFFIEIDQRHSHINIR